MRDDAIPANHVHFAFPDVLSTTSSRDVRAVARALCASPIAPKGVVYCPMDIAITYYLGFWVSNGPLSDVVVLSATGCQRAAGLGPVRASSARVWQALGSTFGLPAGAFRGSWLRGASSH
jgi:hypothetical protein